MITYLISMSFIWMIFLAAYHLLYKKTSYFSFNRIYLLSSICAGLIIPFFPNPISQISQISLYEASQVQTLNISLQEIIVYSSDNQTSVGLDLVSWIRLVYILLMTFSAIQFLRSIRIILKLINQPSEKFGMIKIVHLQKEHIPFSFFNTIAIPINYKGDSNYQIILDHEKAHILKGHHWDILAVSILLIIFPFHPLLYWYRKELKLLHEFQADASILKTFSEHRYASLLLKLSHVQRLNFSIIHSLISSPLKSRIMMFHKKSSFIQSLSYSLIPLYFLLCFSCASQGKISSNYKAMKYSRIDTITVFNPENNKESEMIVQDEFEYYPSVEHMPEFPGGSTEMMKFIQTNLKYPEEMKKENKEGTTKVNLIIKDDGSVIINNFAKSINLEFNNAVRDLVQKMPLWSPGIIKGKKVNTEITLPIKFKL